MPYRNFTYCLLFLLSFFHFGCSIPKRFPFLCFLLFLLRDSSVPFILRSLLPLYLDNCGKGCMIHLPPLPILYRCLNSNAYLLCFHLRYLVPLSCVLLDNNHVVVICLAFGLWLGWWGVPCLAFGLRLGWWGVPPRMHSVVSRRWEGYWIRVICSIIILSLRYHW